MGDHMSDEVSVTIRNLDEDLMTDLLEECLSDDGRGADYSGCYTETVDDDGIGSVTLSGTKGYLTDLLNAHAIADSQKEWA